MHSMLPLPWFQLRTSTIAKDFVEQDRESKNYVLWHYLLFCDFFDCDLLKTHNLHSKEPHNRNQAYGIIFFTIANRQIWVTYLEKV